jgi:NAD(P)-dependent dehydrogenase (short-subunit alcohol dehydrogenase family)
MTFTKETKTIVIGGTSGIGKAVATALANRDGTIEVASRSTGLDVKVEAAIADYFDAQGPVDHVVFTAGSSAPGGAVTDVSFDTAKQAFDTKFWGAVAVAKAAARHIKPGGTITLTSGFLARRTVPTSKLQLIRPLRPWPKFWPKSWPRSASMSSAPA